jgi:hypothetical protein
MVPSVLVFGRTETTSNAGACADAATPPTNARMRAGLRDRSVTETSRCFIMTTDAHRRDSVG